MARYGEQIKITRDANADLSSEQYRAAIFAGASNDEFNVAGADADAIGIIDNDPASGEPATVVVFGVSKAEYGGTVTAGEPLATNASGQLVTATDATVDTTSSNTSQDVAGSPVVARALTSGASGEVGQVLVLAGLHLV